MAGWEKKLKEREEQQRVEVLALPVVPLRRHGRLTAVDDGEVLLSVSAGPEGEAVTLWSTPADRESLTSVTVQPGWASFPDAQAARPADAPDGRRGTDRRLPRAQRHRRDRLGVLLLRLSGGEGPGRCGDRVA